MMGWHDVSTDQCCMPWCAGHYLPGRCLVVVCLISWHCCMILVLWWAVVVLYCFVSLFVDLFCFVCIAFARVPSLLTVGLPYS